MAIDLRHGPGKSRYMCHSCGGVTLYLTPKEVLEEKAQRHDIEPWPPIPSPSDVAEEVARG